mgnify:CR=1 FL=1
MKTKSIIFSALLLAMLGAATTSCEDMLEVDDELHTTNLTPQDTVYQMFGIINRIQSLVDRTVVLGELRADLMDVDPDVAKTSLQEVMDNNITTDNEYNQVADYYAVINACNIYLAYADSTYKSHNRYFFEKEIQAARVFRAWTYLELAKIYGTVPFILDPVLSSAKADDILASTSNRADMNTICTYFIEDLKPYASKTIDTPNYSTVGGYKSTSFFIPSRLMLAELYLWRGSFNRSEDDYLEACRYYHDYFSYTGREVTTGTARTSWTNQMLSSRSDSYSGSFDNDAITIIPLDTCAYDGTWSQLYAIFNSQYENNYYVPVYPSERIREISREQIYCYYSNVNGRRDTIYSTQKEEWEDSLEKGDLRLSVVYNRSYVSNMYTDIYALERQHIMKFASETGNSGPDTKLQHLNLFRRNIVWLHFAEALCRAGFPMTAFTILKYGLDNRTISLYVPDEELSRLRRVRTFFRGNLGAWDTEAFISDQSYNAVNGTANMLGIHSRGSGDSRYNDLYDVPRDSALWARSDSLSNLKSILRQAYNQFRDDYATVDTIHVDTVYERVIERSFDGYGNEIVDTIYNYHDVYDRFVYHYSDTTFVAVSDIFADADSVLLAIFTEDTMSIKDIELILSSNSVRVTREYDNAYDAAYTHDFPIWQDAVEKMILDEEALEGMFEGQRFWDLMRWAMYKGDPDFIAREVARRKGSTEHDSRADALLGGKWYLPLPSR